MNKTKKCILCNNNSDKLNYRSFCETCESNIKADTLPEDFCELYEKLEQERNKDVWQEPENWRELNDLQISDYVELVIYNFDDYKLTCVFNYALGLVAVCRSDDFGYSIKRLTKEYIKDALMCPEYTLNKMFDFKY